MEPDEIKQRLAVRRPGSTDHQEPELAAAWEAAQKDPRLQAWLRQEEALDEHIAQTLDKGIIIPDGLRESLLKIGEQAQRDASPQQALPTEQAANASPANARSINTTPAAHATTPAGHATATGASDADAASHATAQAGEADTYAKARKPHKTGNGFIAFLKNLLPSGGGGNFFSYATACVAMLAVVLVITLMPDTADADTETDLPSFYNAVTTHYSKLPPISYNEQDLQKMRDIIAERDASAPQPKHLPRQLASLKQIGFDIFKWKGHPVTFIRMRNEHKGHLHYLYLIRREDLPADTNFSPEIQKERVNGFDLTSWSGEHNHYVLVSPATEAP